MIKGTFIDAFQKWHMKRIFHVKNVVQKRIDVFCMSMYVYAFNYVEIIWHLIVKTEIPCHKSIFHFLYVFVMFCKMRCLLGI